MYAYIESIAHLGLQVHTSVEETPLGTAGPLRLVEDLLRTGAPYF